MVEARQLELEKLPILLEIPMSSMGMWPISLGVPQKNRKPSAAKILRLPAGKSDAARSSPNLAVETFSSEGIYVDDHSHHAA